MKLYSYIVARDYGFAPNPFHGFCTLATCKPGIRGTAQIGDWVVGTGSSANNRSGYIVFAMRVIEAMTFNEYWCDRRFSAKRPNLSGSRKKRFGDNIYHRAPNSGDWVQEDSHHSYEYGRPNQSNIKRDTKSDRVLISDCYIYWGGYGPEIPSRFRSKGIVISGQGYKYKFPEAHVRSFVRWINSHNDRGYLNRPLDWDKEA